MKNKLILLIGTLIINSVVWSQQVFADLIVDPTRMTIEETKVEEIATSNFNVQYLIVLAVVIVVVTISIVFLNKMKNNRVFGG